MSNNHHQSAPNESDLILTKFQESDLFSLDIESLNEDDLISKYHEARNLKFSFMESLILNLIKHESIVNSKSQHLFEQFDQLLSNILIRVKDDKKLNNYQVNRTTDGNNGIEKVKDEPFDVLNDSCVITNGNHHTRPDSSNAEICISSDEEEPFDTCVFPLDMKDADFINYIENPNDLTNGLDDYQQIYLNTALETKYLNRDYPFSKKMFSTFYDVFGLKSFRKNQLECINAAMLNEDVFILMPTGSGKSICYQLPGVIHPGITIIISPLRSLIQDQVQKLRMIGVQAETLCVDIRQASEGEIYDDLRKDQPDLKLLYVTPEKISQSKRLIKMMEQLYARKQISLFVIDEAHCVSDWAHDFRPDYKRLSMLRQKFTDVPIMALTATATPRVGRDIMKQLRMREPACFTQSFNRPNLRFEVKEKKKDTLDEITSLIKTKFNRKSGIVYCLSRYECEMVAEYLSKNDIKAMPYHAGLTDKSRFQIQENWVIDKFQIVCATIAFGMGVDKQDVRFVIHFSAPKSIEGYYQEAGRAGRDGKLSYCYLYYCYKDIKRLFKLYEESRGKEGWRQHMTNLNAVAYYCTNNLECRKLQILRYFGEKFDATECSKQIASCDNCERSPDFLFKDLTEEAKLIVRSVDLVFKKKNTKFPIYHYVDIYKGSYNAKIKAENHQSLPMHGKGKWMAQDDKRMELFFRKLILEELVQESGYMVGQYDMVVAYLAPSSRGQDLLDGKIKFELPVVAEKKLVTKKETKKDTKKDTNKKSKGESKKTQDELKVDQQNEVKEKNLNNFEEYCYQALLEISNKYATEIGTNQSTIIPLAALKEMATTLPKDQKEFMQIPQNCIELKKNTEQLANSEPVDNVFWADELVELSDDENRPCTSSAFDNHTGEPLSKRLKID